MLFIYLLMFMCFEISNIYLKKKMPKGKWKNNLGNFLTNRQSTLIAMTVEELGFRLKVTAME